MVWVKATALEHITIRAPKAAVFAMIKDVKTSMMFAPGCDLVEDQGGGKFRIRYEPETKLNWTFTADYVVEYTDNGKDHAEWKFVSGNLETDGYWQLSGVDGAVRVTCKRTNEVDAQVPRILKGPAMLAAKVETGRNVAKQLERLKAECER